MNNKRKGFTIVELVIVIAVIGILAAVLIPTFTSLIKKARISEGVQNARQISLNLVSDSVFENKSYYTPRQVIVKAGEYGYDLASKSVDYAYFYNVKTNTVEYLSIDGVLAMEESDMPRSLRNITPDPNLFYIEQSENPIKRAIQEVESLASKNNYDLEAMKDNFKIAITENNQINSLVKSYLSEFSPEQSIYITSKGIIYDSEKNTFKRGIIDSETYTIPKRNDDMIISVQDPIVIDDRVILIENGAFDKVRGNLFIQTSVGYDEQNISVDQTMKVIKRQDKDIIINYLSGDDYYIDYGLSKEGENKEGIITKIEAQYNQSQKTYEEKVKIGEFEGFSSQIVKEYATVSLALLNGGKVDFGNIKKVMVKAKPSEGGKEYELVAVDNNYDVYKIDNVGMITQSAVFYNDDVSDKQKIKVKFGRNAVNFDNVKGGYFELEYKFGYAPIEQMENALNGQNFFVQKGEIIWNETINIYKSNSLKAENDIELNLENNTIQAENQIKNANIAMVTKLVFYDKNGVAIFAERFVDR